MKKASYPQEGEKVYLIVVNEFNEPTIYESKILKVTANNLIRVDSWGENCEEKKLPCQFYISLEYCISPARGYLEARTNSSNKMYGRDKEKLIKKWREVYSQLTKRAEEVYFILERLSNTVLE